MILIFDTFGGLCNQMYDIHCGINFCIHNNIKFSFRYCSFRRDYNLADFYNEKFEKLFDISNLINLENIKNLYINYDILNLTDENTYNLSGERAINLFTDNFKNEIFNINKEFIILKQFWSIYKFQSIIFDAYIYIKPSTKLVNLYNNIKSQLLINNDQYNFLHYRYESDFTNHFNIQVENLKSLILRIKNKYKNPYLKIYIATSNIINLIDLNDTEINSSIIYKNEFELLEYNYEEKAFIDYMIGLNANEIFGHSNSSFSYLLNNNKGTNNFYN